MTGNNGRRNHHPPPPANVVTTKQSYYVRESTGRLYLVQISTVPYPALQIMTSGRGTYIVRLKALANVLNNPDMNKRRSRYLCCGDDGVCYPITVVAVVDNGDYSVTIDIAPNTIATLQSNTAHT